MTLIVLFIALIIERFFDFSHLRHWNWYSYYATFITGKIKVKSSYVVIALLTVPLLFILLILNLLLMDVLYGFLSLLLNVLILLYCFGPQNLWADAYTSLNTLAHDEIDIAADKLKLTFNMNGRTRVPQTMHRILLEHFFVECNIRVFACVVFFIAFGVVGVLLYRLMAILARDPIQLPLARGLGADVTVRAQFILDVLDWFPIRILTFFFALGGNFMQVFATWMKLVLDGVAFNKKLLIECGFKALGDEVSNKIAEDGSAEKSAINLFDRVLIITLVIIALTLLSL